MAKQYKTPGVFIEEIPVFPPSIAQVDTAIPAFIGYTEKAEELDGSSLNNIPKRISSLVEFELHFGTALQEPNLEITINDQETDGNLVNRQIRVGFNSNDRSPYYMHYALRAFFDNGGGPCYIVSVGTYMLNVNDFTGAIQLGDAAGETGLLGGLEKLKEWDEPTLLLFPDGVNLADGNQYYSAINAALSQCQELGDRFTIMDCFGDNDAQLRDEVNGLSNILDEIKYGAAYHPYVESSYFYEYNAQDVQINHDVNGNPGSGSLNTRSLLSLGPENTANPAQRDLPLYNQIRVAIQQYGVVLPPSSFMAGIYAKVDDSRGVWKAPANVSLNRVRRPTQRITDEIQENLNVDTTSGKSINAIRSFRGKGTLVWGARTLAGNDNEWRYVSVRRFFNMVEESAKKATTRFVFEPNDRNTWVKVRSMIENYLLGLWRDGALAGAKPEHAFIVKVGLNETMTSDDILNGRMFVEIYLAAVRPAEFIVLRFMHKMQES